MLAARFVGFLRWLASDCVVKMGIAVQRVDKTLPLKFLCAILVGTAQEQYLGDPIERQCDSTIRHERDVSYSLANVNPLHVLHIILVQTDARYRSVFQRRDQKVISPEWKPSPVVEDKIVCAYRRYPCEDRPLAALVPSYRFYFLSFSDYAGDARHPYYLFLAIQPADAQTVGAVADVGSTIVASRL